MTCLLSFDLDFKCIDIITGLHALTFYQNIFSTSTFDVTEDSECTIEPGSIVIKVWPWRLSWVS